MRTRWLLQKPTEKVSFDTFLSQRAVWRAGQTLKACKYILDFPLLQNDLIVFSPLCKNPTFLTKSPFFGFLVVQLIICCLS